MAVLNDHRSGALGTRCSAGHCDDHLQGKHSTHCTSSLIPEVFCPQHLSPKETVYIVLTQFLMIFSVPNINSTTGTPACSVGAPFPVRAQSQVGLRCRTLLMERSGNAGRPQETEGGVVIPTHGSKELHSSPSAALL